MGTLITPLSGWGRYPVQSCELERPERYADLNPCAVNVAADMIARGQGRSYGDAALNQTGRVLLTERVNRMLDFDTELGFLRAEAGTTLAEILPVILAHGWFLPVTPGTKFVSLGGCVAADVHGKNHHHDGSFGEHVVSIELILADGRRVLCSPSEKPELFWATVGGMGLTGIIGEVTLKLVPVTSAYMRVKNHVAANLEQLFQILQDPDRDDRYAVAWIDCLATGADMGRGVAMFGHHADAEHLPQRLGNPLMANPARGKALPFDLPGWVLNHKTIGMFNDFYFRREGGKRQTFLSGYDAYFYPLDSIGQWNRMYGKRGFVQYQCVIPDATAFDGIRELLQELSATRRASFLAVLKRLGEQGRGMLSFPLAGYTLALDLPLRDDGLFKLLDRLDEIVLRHGGRVYLAKDARLSAESFHAMYPRYDEFIGVKNSVDPEYRFSSSMSLRLGIGSKAI